ncbi:hypothetical protein EV356DRAFT_497983 [Viridothelium virens]|uniref:Uncharacterized protein n=1 Tax=Viridothelium virens TaxID=1048519 RepID=A0A6A6GTD2_VIRVR|nr:hypothetical protein EV356DRAFT_497983 [Viridothelium virens]
MSIPQGLLCVNPLSPFFTLCNSSPYSSPSSHYRFVPRHSLSGTHSTPNTSCSPPSGSAHFPQSPPAAPVYLSL